MPKDVFDLELINKSLARAGQARGVVESGMSEEVRNAARSLKGDNEDGRGADLATIGSAKRLAGDRAGAARIEAELGKIR